MTLPEFEYPHPDDQPTGYRFVRGLWYIGATTTLIISLSLVVHYLAKHGNLTPEEANNLATGFKYLGYFILLGFPLGIIEQIGPHWITQQSTRAYHWAKNGLRGAVGL